MAKVIRMLFVLLVFTTVIFSKLVMAENFNYQNQSDKFWQENLSEQSYQICRKSGTEPARSGQYDKFYEEGTYYCACCGGDHKLFESKAKFDSKTGWPSFYQPIPGAIVERPDPNDKIRGFIGQARIEVICSRCGSHLGHVFDDGPEPTGKRYCMNSAALTFVKKGNKPKRTYVVKE